LQTPISEMRIAMPNPCACLQSPIGNRRSAIVNGQSSIGNLGPRPEPRTPNPQPRALQTFSSANSRSRMMSCQSSRPMDTRMPSGCIPKARFCSSGSAEWVMEKGCSMSVLICPRLTARVME